MMNEQRMHKPPVKGGPRAQMASKNTFVFRSNRTLASTPKETMGNFTTLLPTSPGSSHRVAFEGNKSIIDNQSDVMLTAGTIQNQPKHSVTLKPPQQNTSSARIRLGQLLNGAVSSPMESANVTRVVVRVNGDRPTGQPHLLPPLKSRSSLPSITIAKAPPTPTSPDQMSNMRLSSKNLLAKNLSINTNTTSNDVLTKIQTLSTMARSQFQKVNEPRKGTATSLKERVHTTPGLTSMESDVKSFLSFRNSLQKELSSIRLRTPFCVINTNENIDPIITSPLLTLEDDLAPVSYTHLTLPTIYSV
eukprot:TRINITY_DN5911_c0_g1_i8.p1 TRINITY_DN5911_c0_g1~~TRINITY_DN5911_c0_g1_i8.p1  ORF type:complete len:304 (+),score=35.16 TRINITY_DN5911_c0_g1_i8:80-991(+)